MFASEYFWPEIGGLEHCTERLGAHLAELGHQVAMVIQLLPGTAPHETRSGIAVHRYQTTRAITSAVIASDT